MKNYNFENLRNVGLIGHGATGKTSLAEALLYYTGTTDRLGKNEDGTTVMDYEVEEKKRGISLSTSFWPLSRAFYLPYSLPCKKISKFFQKQLTVWGHICYNAIKLKSSST